MNSNRIRDRWQPAPQPFVLRPSGGSRAPVAPLDFRMMPPGRGLMVGFNRKGRQSQTDPLPIVATEEAVPKKSAASGKH